MNANELWMCLHIGTDELKVVENQEKVTSLAEDSPGPSVEDWTFGNPTRVETKGSCREMTEIRGVGGVVLEIANRRSRQLPRVDGVARRQKGNHSWTSISVWKVGEH
jgi:hypothetical protein